MRRGFWLVATLLLAACGSSELPAPDASGDDGATQQSEELDQGTEIVASDPSGVENVGQFRLGVDYFRLSPTQPTSSSPDKVEVAEVFWYGCPHCRAFEPYLARWLQTKPEYVSFVRIPAVWNGLLQLHARAFYTAEALGKGAEMHEEFFREIHERGNALDTEQKLQEFFGRFGVDAAMFQSTFESFAVQTKLQRADELSRRYRIGSVPTLIVNGKYTTEGGQAASYDDLLSLVTELAASEHSAQQ